MSIIGCVAKHDVVGVIGPDNQVLRRQRCRSSSLGFCPCFLRIQAVGVNHNAAAVKRHLGIRNNNRSKAHQLCCPCSLLLNLIYHVLRRGIFRERQPSDIFIAHIKTADIDLSRCSDLHARRIGNKNVAVGCADLSVNLRNRAAIDKVDRVKLIVGPFKFDDRIRTNREILPPVDGRLHLLRHRHDVSARLSRSSTDDRLKARRQLRITRNGIGAFNAQGRRNCNGDLPHFPLDRLRLFHFGCSHQNIL